VNVPERSVTVEAPHVSVEAPHVTVEAAEQVRSVRTIERDDQGNIARIIEE
jgi:phage baseplate assembly protein gpV